MKAKTTAKDSPTSVRLPGDLKKWVIKNGKPAKRGQSAEIVVCLSILKRISESPDAEVIKKYSSLT